MSRLNTVPAPRRSLQIILRAYHLRSESNASGIGQDRHSLLSRPSGCPQRSVRHIRGVSHISLSQNSQDAGTICV